MKKKTAATRKDVAERAGVSLSIVSRVLNKSGYVAQEKRKRVLEVVEELNYKPHPVALSLKNSRTKQFLYYIRELNNYYYIEMYRGMTEYASARNYAFIIAGGLDRGELGKLMVDGIIMPTQNENDPEFMDSIHVPVVAAGYGYRIKNEKMLHVYVDIWKAVELAVEHLYSLGHRKIAYAGPDDSLRDQRLQAFSEVMESKGLEPQYIMNPLTVEDNYYLEMGSYCADKLISSTSDISGIVCFNDDVAISMMSALQMKGVKIPDDLSVVGIDNHQGAQYCYPPLTTVSLEAHKHGWECARALVDIVEGNEWEPPEPIKPVLVVRNSTA